MITPYEFFSSLDPSLAFWAGIGAWCVYQMVQALRCIYYVIFEPWVVEEEDEDDVFPE